MGIFGLDIGLTVELNLRISVFTFLQLMSNGRLLIAVADGLTVIDAGDLQIAEVHGWTW